MAFFRPSTALITALLVTGLLTSAVVAWAADAPEAVEPVLQKTEADESVKPETPAKEKVESPTEAKTESRATEKPDLPAKKVAKPDESTAPASPAPPTSQSESSASADKSDSVEPAKPKSNGKTRRRSFLSKLKAKLSADKGESSADKAEDEEPSDAAVSTSGDEEKAPDEAKSKKSARAKTLTVARLTIRGDYSESPSPDGPFGEIKPSLASLIGRFDALVEDKSIDAVVLDLEDAELGAGRVSEIRQAIGRVRAAGKPVYAVITAADAGQYLLAAACDEIVMVPSGMLLIPGVRAEVTFFKGLLDKIGVEADMLQMGKFKGAGEPLTRTEMSDELRESLEAVIDDTYERFVANVAADRKLEDYQVRTYIDQGLFTAADARRAGLVDHVDYPDAFLDELPKKHDAETLDLVEKYKKRRRTDDFSGVGGMMRLMQLMLGGKPGETAGAGKKIAVIYAIGPIMQGRSSSSVFGIETLGSTTLVEALREADDDSTVVAIVLRVDSPGGSAIASDLIWRETVRIEKPIIASMGNVAGSGGYYIAVGADKILAAPGTLTGSIGVVGGKLVTGKLYEKIGLSTEVIHRGKNSGLFATNQPFSPSEREAWLTSMKEIYRQFVAKSAEGRNMSFEDLEELAQGRVYTGAMAAANGLVDDLGTLHDAVAEAKKAAGLDADDKVELLILPRPRSMFERLFGDPDASLDADAMLGQIATPLAALNLARQIFAEPVLTVMPCLIELK